MRVADLSVAETLLVQRRRAGLRQVQAAKRFGVSVQTYRRWETGELDPSGVASWPREFRGLPGGLKAREKMLILRRRAGKTQAQLAEKLGVSQIQVHAMERGKIELTRKAISFALTA